MGKDYDGKTLLKRCGWDDKQIGFYGTMVHNVTTSDGTPVADVVSRNENDGVLIEWYVPNKEGERISLSWLNGQGINHSKTDPGIKNENDIEAFISNVEGVIKNTRGIFMPKTKVVVETTKPTNKV